MPNSPSPRVGEIRPTQIMHTYGVGSLIDLPKISVVVTGLQDWPTNPEYTKPVNESRLLEAVQFHLHSVQRLLLPPIIPDTGTDPDIDDPAYYIGVPVATFPRWMVCPSCRLLAPLNSGLFQLKENPYRMDETCYIHSGCNSSRNPEVIPARFLAACEKGHLDDFPWIEFVHRDNPPCNAPQLVLIEHGPSGEARDLEVKCTSCGEQRRLSEAFGVENRDHMPDCKGRRPHLRDFDPDPCGLKMRTIILGASNTWFPVSLSTIGIPVSADILLQLIEEKWGELQAVSDIGIIAFLRTTGNLGRLSQYTNERIFSAIHDYRQNQSRGIDHNTRPDLKSPEWKVFTEHNPALNCDDFQLRSVTVPPRYSDLISQVVLVERLREVTALIGFTRIDSGGEMTDELDIPTENAPLSVTPPTWVPASEVRGEGIFIQFDEQKISSWVNKPEILAANEEFFQAHRLWCQARGLDNPENSYPGMRYVLLHSFSHSLMRQLSLECGYSAASMRERIYSQSPAENRESMAGILIYTSAPDSEGTLGGLVKLGETDSLGLHIEQALDASQLCANDPLCAEHMPGSQGQTIHAAACHACLFSPETSCERGNRFLDRALLVPTVEKDNRNFFSVA